MATNLTSIPVDEIRALADERERYEGWIGALEARRGHTPPHVYDRVKQDYAGRLGGVMDRLTSHLAGLRDGETTLAGRDDELARALAERQDELAEAELRTLVGEYDAETGTRLQNERAGQVRALESERAEVDGELATVRELIARSGPAPAKSSGPQERAAGQQEMTPSGVDDNVWRGETQPTASAAPPPDASPAQEPARAAANVLEPSGAAPWTEGSRPSIPVPASAAASGTAPEGEKTLRCQECGAMNYPTEWYCERCGGELAAM